MFVVGWRFVFAVVGFDIALVGVSLVLCGFGVGWWWCWDWCWGGMERGSGETSDISCVAGGCLLGGG